MSFSLRMKKAGILNPKELFSFRVEFTVATLSGNIFTAALSENVGNFYLF